MEKGILDKEKKDCVGQGYLPLGEWLEFCLETSILMREIRILKIVLSSIACCFETSSVWFSSCLPTYRLHTLRLYSITDKFTKQTKTILTPFTLCCVCVFFFFNFYLFMIVTQRERERGRDTGRGRSRLHAPGARCGI